MKSLDIDGGGWRMPTRAELKGICMKKKNSNDLHLDPVFKTTGWDVWSGELTDDSSSAFSFTFNFGYENWFGRTFSDDGRGFSVRSGRR